MQTKLTQLLGITTLAFALHSSASAELIGHYTFDDPLNLGADSSGHGNHADAVNLVGFTPAGVSGGAASFTASSQSYLYWGGLSDAIANSVGGDFSFSVWVRTTQENDVDSGNGYDGAGIIYSDIRGGHDDTIPLAITGNKAAFFTGITYEGNTLHSTTDINTDEFVHVVVTRELSSGDKAIYINGVLEATTTHGPGIPLNERGELYVGGNFSDADYFDGILDDLRVYNEVLSPSDVLTLYSAIPEPGTALWGGLALLGLAVRRTRSRLG